jgi:hypothetical protein
MIRAVAIAVLLSGCDGTCQTPNQDGPGVAGTFRYTTGDGAAVDGALERMAIVHMTAAAAFSITGAFDDALGEHRTFEIDAGNFVPGMGPIDTAGLVQLCMVRATGDEPVCSDFAGTIDVRQLAADCYNHESGVGACAETIDFTLTASSAWEDTSFAIDATELTIGQWISVACED